MRQELIGGPYIQADETPVDVQLQEGRGKNHQAYLWQHSRPRGTVVFDFRLGRGREGPRQFLGRFEVCCRRTGMPPTSKSEGPKMVHAGCWSQAERYFPRRSSSTLKARWRPQSSRESTSCLPSMRRPPTTLSLEARDILPQEQSRPLLDVIRQPIEAARSTALPGGASQGFELRAHPVGSVDSLSGIPGTGVEQQLGGELDGTGGTRSKELDPHREHAGRTEDRGYSLGRGKPSPVEAPSARLLGCNPSRNSQRSDPGTI